MKTLSLWTNGSKRIGINVYGKQLLVIASVDNGNCEVITSNIKCVSLPSAKRAVLRLISNSKTTGEQGEFTKIK